MKTQDLLCTSLSFSSKIKHFYHQQLNHIALKWEKVRVRSHNPIAIDYHLDEMRRNLSKTTSYIISNRLTPEDIYPRKVTFFADSFFGLPTILNIHSRKKSKFPANKIEPYFLIFDWNQPFFYLALLIIIIYNPFVTRATGNIMHKCKPLGCREGID